MQPQSAQTIRYFWQPGCSACVKIKEMMSDNGIPFESINVLENEEGLEELNRRGIRALPVVLRGEDMVFGQSLEDVTKFLGIARESERLPLPVLAERWTYFLDKALTIIEKMPDRRLPVRAYPERPRSLLALSSHVFQIPEAFVAVMDDGLDDTRPIVNRVADDLGNKENLLAYARGIRSKLEKWIAANPDLGENRIVKTYWGTQPAPQLLERFTWHSAQHTRQLDHILTIETGTPSLIDPKMYEGLPMPKGMWE